MTELRYIGIQLIDYTHTKNVELRIAGQLPNCSQTTWLQPFLNTLWSVETAALNKINKHITPQPNHSVWAPVYVCVFMLIYNLVFECLDKFKNFTGLCGCDAQACLEISACG